MTSRRHAALPHDAEASLRAELSTHIAGAQSEIEHRLAELSDAVAHGGNGGALDHAKQQLTLLSKLQRRIGEASVTSLATLRGEVTAAVAATHMMAQQANVNDTPTYQTVEVALQRASEGARVSVTGFMHDYYDRHEFDRYLKFTSSEDEDEYRRREEERKKAIGTAMAEHTPQGNLKALDLSIEQLKDAGAHGADKSADYQPMLQGMQRNRDALAAGLEPTKSAALRVGRDATEAAPTDVKLDAAVAPDLLASIRAAQIAIADPSQEGHGVANRTTDAGAGRTAR